MMNSFRILKNLFKKKYTFRILQKKPILIYDYLSLRELKNFIPKKKFEVLDNRNEINLLILIKMILNLKFNKYSYYKQYFETVCPKLIITTSDHDIFFYKIKNLYPAAKTAMIQLCYRHDKYSDIFSVLKNQKLKEKYLVDYIFCFSSGFAKEYLKYIKGNPIVIGSVRNNSYIKVKKKKKTITFISQYRQTKANHEDYIIQRWQNKTLLHSEFFSLEKKLMPIIVSFCKNLGYKFRIIGCARNNINAEKKFYQNLIKDIKWTYLSRIYENKNFSYKWINESTINIFTESTLGFESIARGIKTISFYARKHLNNNASFGWPSKKKSKGFFWTNRITKNEVSRLLNNVISVNNKKWSEILKKETSSIIYLDEKNKILQNFLNKFI